MEQARGQIVLSGPIGGSVWNGGVPI